MEITKNSFYSNVETLLLSVEAYIMFTDVWRHALKNGPQIVHYFSCAAYSGHCVEFNLLGGVIQDQRSSPCNDTFPKCDSIYDSTTAFKYPDCYQLVSMNRIYQITKKMPVTRKQDVSKSTSTENVLIISISTFLIVAIIVFTPAMAVKMPVKERRKIPKHNENVELTSTDAF